MQLENMTVQEPSSHLGKHVLIRTYSAGVHFGILVRKEHMEVELQQARRIYSWEGANTLSEISLHGVSPRSKISEAVPTITLTEAIEILPLSPKSIQCLSGIEWGK